MAAKMPTTAAIAILTFVSCEASGAAWYLIDARPSELYMAVQAFRVETTLIAKSEEGISLWARRDYVRDEKFEYPSNPVTVQNDVIMISTAAVIWEKSKLDINCTTQNIRASVTTTEIHGDPIGNTSSQVREFSVIPDTPYEIIFHLSCESNKPREPSQIIDALKALEKRLVPNKDRRDSIRNENVRPDWYA